MQALTEADAAKVGDVARRNDVSLEAATAVLDALLRGDGSQAQFSHPDLGGMGQWSRGGMIMVGDMFNSRLKARVDQLCTDLSDLLRDGDLLSVAGREADGDQDRNGWWPAGCGTPASSGNQNDMRYAYFPGTRRLAIKRHGNVTLYDTGDHRISGVSQQQSGTQDLAFTSQHGPVKLHDLKRVERGDTMPEASEQSPATATESSASAKHVLAEDDGVFATIERLHGLQQKGVLSEVEFIEKKKELLARL